MKGTVIPDSSHAHVGGAYGAGAPGATGADTYSTAQLTAAAAPFNRLLNTKGSLCN